MTTRRVKALALEDDDYDHYDEDYGEEEEDDGLTAEDRQQLAAGTVAVRAELGDDFPATDKDIQDSLWHYYYDIGKTVSYLKSMCNQDAITSMAAKISDKHTPSPKTKTKKKPEQTPVVAQHPVDAINFFDGIPWLNIPPCRQSLISIEPGFMGRGLLGGSAKGEKMSKLAALAAKRRLKENSKPTTQTPDGQGLPENYVSSLKALHMSSPKTPDNTSINDLTEQRGESSTTQPHVSGKPEETSPTKENQHLGCLEAQFDPAELRAKPSSFASTILGPKHPAHILDLESGTNLAIQGFDFTGPSPDDIVTKAQAAKVHTPAKQTPKQPKLPKPELGAGVANLSIQETPKIKSKHIDVVAEYNKIQRKNATNFVVIGHVDAGKSTLMGRLLFDLKAVDERTMERYKREAENIGKGSFAFAWVLDQGSEERARGVTIDIATNNFETEKTKFTILDAPGHRDFVPNMIAGASQADFAVLVIDASTGNFESGLKGQTKEHALLVRSIGVQRIIVAVNKMDAVDWTQDRFKEIQQQMSGFLTTAGFQPKNVAFVPCSGMHGDNILHKSKEPKLSWYHGLSLVEELDKSEPTTFAVDKPLRMTIGDVFRGGVQNPLSVSGRIEAGNVQIGEQVLIMPSGEKASIKSLEVDEEPQEWAVAGQNVILNLTDIDPIHLKTGDVLCSTASPIQNLTEFRAKVLAFDHLTPMPVDVHRGRLSIPGRITRLVATLDKATGAVVKQKPKIVQPGSVVRLVVTLDQAVPLESPARVILRNGGDTIGAGLVE